MIADAAITLPRYHRRQPFILTTTSIAIPSALATVTMSGTRLKMSSNEMPITVREFTGRISEPIVVLEQDSRNPFGAPPDLPDLERPQYVHRLMEYDTSIRLVKVLHPYKDGTPRCKVEERDMAADSQAMLYRYTCLSYVWGSPEHSRWIILNGHPFRVRKNLWDFLCVVSQIKVRSADRDTTKLYPDTGTRQPHNDLQSTSVEFQNSAKHNIFEFMWIDALCIDQTSTVEKNHQVQRMGHIYSHAEQVVAWLGNQPKVANLFVYFLDDLATATGATLEQEDFLKAFCEDQYWKRAWITQELLLGNAVFLLAQGVMIHLAHLHRFVANIDINEFDPDYLFGSSPERDIIQKAFKLLVEGIVRGGTSLNLIENIELYGHKLCADPRDLAYSLLSVSNDGTKLQVDYDYDIFKLAKDIMSMSESSLCIKRAAVVARGLNIDRAGSGVDADVSIIEVEASSMLRHISPCEQCGEECNTKSLHLHPAQVARTRCICLHCCHLMSKEKAEVHQRAHLGHLILFPISKDVKQSSNWHLAWTPMGGGSWRKLQGRYEVALSDKGAVRKLLLSAGILLELADAAMEESSQRPSNVHEQTHESSWATKWTVAE